MLGLKSLDFDKDAALAVCHLLMYSSSIPLTAVAQDWLGYCNRIIGFTVF